MLARAFKLKDKRTCIKKREVPTSELISELDRLKKEKREQELRRTTLSQIKQLKREESIVYRFGKKIADNIKDEDKTTKRKKKVDGYLNKLGEFGKW